MAIFHMSFSNISAGKMRSAVASAAYRSGEYLFSDQEQKGYLYGRSVLPEAFILVPENAPAWAQDRQRLWNEVEAVDRKANSRYAKEFNVALPVELSAEEQKELLTTYVQKNFVDAGMVADVAIHRDHDDNPHAHVMLTNRPFNPDGTWGQKSKTEYILDDQGNKTYTKNGNVRNRKIWLVDWDKKEKITEWRHNWASAVNQVLEQKGLPDRISEKSYADQGVNQQPTEHEGHTQFSEKKQAYNQDNKRKRSAQNDKQYLDEKIKSSDHFDALRAQLSYHEKHMMKEMSRELQTYVDLEHLEDKQRLLANWKSSVVFKHALGADVTRQLGVIYQQEQTLEQANQLLDKVSDRVITKLYPSLEHTALTVLEKRQLVKETNGHGQPFTVAELPDVLADIRVYTLEQQILGLVERPYSSLKMIDRRRNAVVKLLTDTLSAYGEDYNALNAVARGQFGQYEEKDQRILKGGIREIKKLQRADELVNAQYEGVLTAAYPYLEYQRLSDATKERLYMMTVYYNPKLATRTPAQLEQLKEHPPMVFSHKDHVLGLKALENSLVVIENPDLKRVLAHDGMRRLFLDEARKDPLISVKDVDRLAATLQQKTLAKEARLKQHLPDYQGTLATRGTIQAFLAESLSENILAGLEEMWRTDDQRQHQRRRNQAEWEMTKKQRQHTVRNAHEDPSSGLHL